MGKRAGLLRIARKSHEEKSKPKSSAVKKHKLKLKLKKASHTVPAVAAAGTAAAASDIFGMALPAPMSDASAASRTDAVAATPAFIDDSKEALLRQILGASKSAATESMIPADAHRARMAELKRKKLQKKSGPRYLRR